MINNICGFDYILAKFVNSTDSNTEFHADRTASGVADQVKPSLPSMKDLPDADVLIFDGECSFCTTQVKKISRWSNGRLAFLSLHDPQVEKLYPDLTEEMLMKQMYLVSTHGHRYAGAGVLRYLSRKLPRLWVFAPLLHIPWSLGFWQWCYSQIAKRRYRISSLKGKHCDSGKCDVHFK